MKKSYEATFDESVDVAFRQSKWLGVYGKQRRLGSLALLFMLFVFCAFGGLLVDELKLFCMIGIAFGTLCGALQYVGFEKTFRKNLRKTLTKAWGADQPVPAEFELEEAGLVFRSRGSEIRTAWDRIVEVRDLPDKIELSAERGGFGFIPKRIFDSPEQSGEWLRFIEEHIGADAQRGEPVNVEQG